MLPPCLPVVQRNTFCSTQANSQSIQLPPDGWISRLCDLLAPTIWQGCRPMIPLCDLKRQYLSLKTEIVSAEVESTTLSARMYLQSPAGRSAANQRPHECGATGCHAPLVTSERETVRGTPGHATAPIRRPGPACAQQRVTHRSSATHETTETR